MTTATKANPFKLNGALGLNRVPLLEQAVERSLALHRLSHLYTNLSSSCDCMEFLQQTLDTFNIRYQTEAVELENVPKEGPAVLVANHPYGAIEGVMMAHLLLQIRPDIKIMANHFLLRIPELRELFIGVDPFGGDGSVQSNSGPMREAIRWVRKGGLLLVFPAGEVSHFRPTKGRVMDPDWSSSIIRLIRMTRAQVIPSYIHGQNGKLFQLAGLLHPRLRTALLPRQLTNKAGYRIPIRFGRAISERKLSALGKTEKQISKQLRLHTYMLGEELRHLDRQNDTHEHIDAVAVATQTATAAVFAQEVSGLPENQRLVESDGMEVYIAGSDQIPNLMQEIGRLREITFRATGEGTGRERDIDIYDSYYQHLFIWNKEEQEIVGAYRLGLADEILRKCGRKGLYSYSLFKYNRLLLEHISPAIELGRSFICQKYQRSFAPLLLLWKGIGAFVQNNPRYRVLFGPVSISGEYHTLSQQMMVTFLEQNRNLDWMAQQIKPRRPFPHKRVAWMREELSGLKEIDSVSNLISQLEPDCKGVPILLKQYLKMGGQVLGFNLDPDFNNTLDGLIMVDLLQSPEKLLQRYMGAVGAKRFAEFHAAPTRIRSA